MALGQDIKERIFTAADELYAASDTGEFPNVEAVRQLSRAGMNNVVEAMKEWRQKQRKQVQTVREPMPAAMLAVLQETGQSLWATAQQLANESLEAAKAAFEAEKNDLMQLSVEQSEAYEMLAGALEQVKADAASAIQSHQEAAQRTADELAAVRVELAQATTKAERAEAKANEIEHRAADLRAELDRAHQDADNLRAELNEQKQTSQAITAERDTARSELVKVQATVEAERSTNQKQQHIMAADITSMRAELAEARNAVTEARETAARLAGQLEATQKHTAALLAQLGKPVAKTTTRAKAKKE